VSDDWNLTYEKVEPHGLCCAECKQARARVEELEAALRWERDTHGISHPADCGCPVCAALATDKDTE
jgi:hypothetical protein